MKRQRVSSLSLDLDNLWSYMKTHGDAGWETHPSYLDIAVPRILEFLGSRALRITFFVVGQDAALETNRGAFEAIAGSGHEIGNHSFLHEPWLHLYSESDLHADLGRAEASIERATGQRPVGFRGPGFSLSPTLLRVLKVRGYLYDASTLPTFLNPVARTYFLMTSRLSGEERRKRKALFGSFSDGFRPNRPYRWPVDQGGLIEVPVTTMPIFRIPIHASYILFLSCFSRAVALAYFRAALRLCRWTGTEPSFLLHPLDFLGCDDTKELAFFPAMRMPAAPKLEVLAEILGLLAASFTVVTVGEHARLAARLLPQPGDAVQAPASGR